VLTQLAVGHGSSAKYDKFICDGLPGKFRTWDVLENDHALVSTGFRALILPETISRALNLFPLIPAS